VGAKRVIGHVGFERNLRRRGPPSFEVRSEVPLSEEPPRLDYLLLRKLTPGGEPVDNSAQTLRYLWPLLPRVSVVEYKSPGHPYRSGQLDRLWAYVHTYFANQRALPRHRADGTPLTPAEGGPEVREREDLCAVLVIAARLPSSTPTPWRWASPGRRCCGCCRRRIFALSRLRSKRRSADDSTRTVADGSAPSPAALIELRIE